MATQEVMTVGERDPFSEATAARGRADPGGKGPTRARQDRAAAAGRREATEAPGGAQTDPALVPGEATVLPGNDNTADAVGVAERTPELERWETEGGTCPTLIDR